MTTHYFTFGSAHRHPETGETLDRCYVAVDMPADAPYDAWRARMFRFFGPEWCAEYLSPPLFSGRAIDMPTSQYDRGKLGPDVCAWMDANDPDMAPASRSDVGPVGTVWPQAEPETRTDLP